MSTVKDFLIPLEDLKPERKEVKFSKFPKPFVVESITEERNTQLRKSSTVVTRNRQGGKDSEFKNEVYMSKLVVECVKQPDLQNEELQNHYGTTGSAGDTIRKMLTPGEYARLLEVIQQVNGFDEDPTLEELKDEVKND